MIERSISAQILQLAKWFPVVSVTGPRQSGKSTLVKRLFPDYEYVNLEDQRILNIVRESPMDFLLDHPGQLVIDEAQKVPDLFSAIQVISDEAGEAGRFILSGSQNFLLLKGITQSLAGRVGIMRLLPLSYTEAASASAIDVDSFMLQGGYPRLYNVGMPANVFYRSYVSTYVQRDAADYIGPRSLSSFTAFLGMCAQSAGNLMNVSRLASDVGVARATIDSWLSVLEASYIIFRLSPYHANLRKRLTKTSKLYFYDTGLLCHLLGIQSTQQLRDSDFRGAVFENLVIAETLKRHMNAGADPRLFFYRDDSKIEVDLVDFTTEDAPELAEIKAAQVYKSSFARHLAYVGEALGVAEEGRHVVLRGGETHHIPSCTVWAAHDWLNRFDDDKCSYII